MWATFTFLFIRGKAPQVAKRDAQAGGLPLPAAGPSAAQAPGQRASRASRASAGRRMCGSAEWSRQSRDDPARSWPLDVQQDGSPGRGDGAQDPRACVLWLGIKAAPLEWPKGLNGRVSATLMHRETQMTVTTRGPICKGDHHHKQPGWKGCGEWQSPAGGWSIAALLRRRQQAHPRESSRRPQHLVHQGSRTYVGDRPSGRRPVRPPGDGPRVAPTVGHDVTMGRNQARCRHRLVRPGQGAKHQGREGRVGAAWTPPGVWGEAACPPLPLQRFVQKPQGDTMALNPFPSE